LGLEIRNYAVGNYRVHDLKKHLSEAFGKAGASEFTPPSPAIAGWRLCGLAFSGALLYDSRKTMTMNMLPKSVLLFTCAGAALTMTAQTTPETSSVVAPGAKLKKLSGEFKFTEGPSCDAAGNVFFTDQPNNRIMKWSVDGKLSTFLQPAGRANGMYFDAHGNLLACADEKTELWSIAPDGTHTVLAGQFNGKPLNGPNDVWVRPDGGMYLTDPFYKRDWWDYNQRPQDSEQVYFLSADRKPLQRVTTDFNKPNGIIGTPDGKTLFVSDIGAGKTYGYDIQPDGTLANKRLACAMGSDGMTLDNEGNLYLTGTAGVTVFDKTGKKIDVIRVAEPWTANVCFGGKDRQTLFIMASKGLYSIRLRVKGANPAK
jgi:gluconolactonase